MTVEIREEPIDTLAEQASVSIAFTVDRVLVPTLVDGGLGGITFEEAPVDPAWVKDYDAADGHGPAHWAQTFDVSNWGFLVARDGDTRVGGAVIAFDTADVDMLDGRRDLVVVWDLRVQTNHRGTGAGTTLWHAAEEWARARACRHLKVETQNINVAACRFYARMGCILGAVDRFGYYPDLPDEIELLWYKELSGQPR